MHDLLRVSVRSETAQDRIGDLIERRMLVRGRGAAKYGRRRERGMALIVAIFALLLLSAAGMGMLYMASTESTVGSNYRDAQATYFDARAGIEEARSRIGAQPADPAGVLPTAMPTASNQQVIYIINGSTSACPGAIQPWNPQNPCNTSQPNPYFDTELCHEGDMFPSGVLNNPGPNYVTVPCAVSSNSVPSGSGWYKSVTSDVPSGLNYKWVRITLKANVGADPNGSTGTKARYVNNQSPYTNQPAAQVYWNNVGGPYNTGAETLASGGSNTPVYMVTSLAVSSLGSMGSRRMLQAEVTVPPPPGVTFPYAVEATSNVCGAITMSGGPYIDSYNSNNGAYGAALSGGGQNKFNSGAPIATYGGVSLSGSSMVYGPISAANVNISSGHSPPACTGTGNSINYGIVSTGTSSCSSGTCTPANGVMSASAPTPPPTPPTLTAGTAVTLGANVNNTYTPAQVAALSTAGTTPSITLTHNSAATFTGGSTATNIYQLNITGDAAVTMNAGTYNIDSLTISNGCVLNINGTVIINITGTDGSVYSGGGSSTAQVYLTGGTVTNSSQIPANFILNYAATSPNAKQIVIDAGAAAYVAINAPGAPVNLTGGSDIYGAIVASTVIDNRGPAVHYDVSLGGSGSNNPTAGGLMINFRELMY